MKVWIPRCGDAVSLLQPWTLWLHYEHRNVGVYDMVEPRPGAGDRFYRRDVKPVSWTVPAGTELVFDRVYIRQNNDEFASVTFIVKEHPDDSFVGERFWAKLDDVNNLDVLLMSSDNPVGGFAKAGYRALAAARKNPEVAQKAAKAKASKEELEVVREELCATVSRGLEGSSVLRSFVRGIIADVMRQAQGKFDHCDEEMVAYYMTVPENGSSFWQCAAIRRNPDGTVERDMRFTWRTRTREGGYVPVPMRHSGFTVTTRDGAVVAMAQLT